MYLNLGLIKRSVAKMSTFQVTPYLQATCQIRKGILHTLI